MAEQTSRIDVHVDPPQPQNVQVHTGASSGNADTSSRDLIALIVVLLIIGVIIYSSSNWTSRTDTDLNTVPEGMEDLPAVDYVANPTPVTVPGGPQEPITPTNPSPTIPEPTPTPVPPGEMAPVQ